ncbi:CDP-glucose 4,6-dehydratase [Amylibacter sp.]|jgi:CDP-glucose 4,6-dehydratase|nr:CDP-glucose 4,6-dehydratase [Amylibacter sp.]
MSLFANFYNGKRVLITGHTGFKGDWLSLWLNKLGAHVIGVSLEENEGESQRVSLQREIEDFRVDIRDYEKLNDVVVRTKPDLIFHLAAQSLVRESYRNPLQTWSTNVMGTANLLEAAINNPTVRAVLVVTTDKCYKNKEWHWGYRETDELGGHDPYSASKAASEIVADSFRSSFCHNSGSDLLIATARAGNVIGGGDWSKERLIPDVIRSIQNHNTIEIRSPNAIRPWQHVLDSLSGYLLLCEKLVSNGEIDFADAWNFGPSMVDNLTVSEVLNKLRNELSELKWTLSGTSHLHETATLKLDISKARAKLNWSPTWDVDNAIEKTAVWYKNWITSGFDESERQLDLYIADAHRINPGWV